MESAKCNLCFRQFSNRKALGGHMRSHMAKLAVRPRSDCTLDNEEESQNRRSKRARRSVKKNPDSPESSVVCDADFISVEEAAELLLKLSRDKSPKKKDVVIYRCETCKKGFQSYQALGGHRASHKKIKIESDEEQGEEEGEEEEEEIIAASNSDQNQRTFECPYCFKVFQSGQAMGGHKKIHMSGPTFAKKVATSAIDLNLPAPEEDNRSQVDDSSIKSIS